MPRNRAGTQPIRVPTDGDYGEAKQLEESQRAVPLPDNQAPAVAPGGPPSLPAGGEGGTGQPEAPPVARPDVFGPSTQPNQAATAGSLLPDDPVLNQLHAVQVRFPSEGLARYIERYGRRVR